MNSAGRGFGCATNGRSTFPRTSSASSSSRPRRAARPRSRRSWRGSIRSASSRPSRPPRRGSASDFHARPNGGGMSRKKKSAARGLSLAVVAGIAVLATALLGGAQAAPPVVSDSVRTWDAHALAAIFNATNAPVPGAGQPPPVGTLHMAMTQIAVYDAVNSIAGGHQPYIKGLPKASPDASIDAAVITAAHDVLVGLGIAPVPALPQVVRDRLDMLRTDALAAIPDGTAKEDGKAAGAAAAAAILAERTGDGRFVPYTNPVGDEAGEWRPTLPAFANDPFAWVAYVDPFTLRSGSQFRTKGPLDITSRQYAKEYNEVKDLGSSTTTARTPEQQAIAAFFQPNPVEMLQRALRDVTKNQGIGVVDEARFYAQLNVATADALINCWDEKNHWLFWRPITAIQEGDNDGNPRTTGDAAWLPLIATPPYSDHTSGYNCATGALMNTAELFLGSKADLHVTNLAIGVTRDYTRFDAVPLDTIEARILQGIHFRTADVDGAKLGKNVARWVNSHYFKKAK